MARQLRFLLFLLLPLVHQVPSEPVNGRVDDDLDAVVVGGEVDGDVDDDGEEEEVPSRPTVIGANFDTTQSRRAANELLKNGQIS